MAERLKESRNPVKAERRKAERRKEEEKLRS
jgi:hypothetical protein